MPRAGYRVAHAASRHAACSRSQGQAPENARIGGLDEAEANMDAPEQHASAERAIKPRPRHIRITHDTVVKLAGTG